MQGHVDQAAAITNGSAGKSDYAEPTGTLPRRGNSWGSGRGRRQLPAYLSHRRKTPRSIIAWRSHCRSKLF